MFAKSIVLSDAFLDMPASTRCLYFTLGMFADDDGFVNSPKSVMRQSGATEDDMRILISKKFILPFESGVVVVKHWRIHNYIQNDRHKMTNYVDEMSTLELDENKAYRFVDTERIQNVSRVDTQDSIGKNNINNNISSLRSDISSVRKTDYDVIKDLWNSLEPLGIKAIRNIQSKRHTLVQARLKQYGLDGFREAIENIKMSDFLQGKHSGREWIITFDWFILPSNFPKVLEGNYNNKSNGNHATYGNQYQEEKQWGVDDELRE